MNTALRARMARELGQGRWTQENHAKLVSFLATYAIEAPGRPAGAPLAVFDADNTTWTGDLGDAAFVTALRDLELSPRLHEVLPFAVDVPAEGFGLTAPGRLFPAARVRDALEAMAHAYRRAVAPDASVPDFLAAFTEALVLPGGALHGDADFTGAYRVYTGTMLALYNLLERAVGCVSHDFADVRDATLLYPSLIRDFYGRERARSADLARFTRSGPDGRCDILFPAVRDTGAEQRSLRARGQLGSYTQIAAWVALDRTPEELGRFGLRVWEGSPPLDTSFDVVFPVDAAGAASPAPLDFAAVPDRAAQTAGAVAFGSSAMLYGTRARPEMVDLMTMMVRHGVTPVVITASHVDLVRAVLARHYGLGEQPLVGMTPALVEGRYGADLTAPVPYRAGKVDAARAVARRLTGREDARPVFCAGDSNTDLEFVAYSGDYRLFFDRRVRPFMDLAAYLGAHGDAQSTVIQEPFAD